ncbi:hypothetical protein [Tumebacillus amylolyticus]|nr:hypothetical protein [Tumebacillus amylolyticus]
MNSFVWEVLDRDKHDVQGFSSGYEEFDEYLRRDAVLDQAGGLSQTRVLCKGRVVVAYYSSKCSKLEINETERMKIGSKDQSVPAVEIPMLAVDHRFQRNRVGTEVLTEIILRTVYLSQFLGCRYLFLRAVKADWLIQWYRKFEFVPIQFEVVDEYTQPMSFKLPTVRELSQEEFEDLF